MSPTPSASLLLAVDSSGSGAGVVLAGAGRTESALLPLVGSAARTEDLAAVTAGLLRARSAGVADIGIVAGVVGPGSYTGLRSGLAFLRGIAFGSPTRAIAVGSLELLARRAGRAGETLAVAMSVAEGRIVVAAYRWEDDDLHELVAPALVDSSVPGTDLQELRNSCRSPGSGLSALVVAAADSQAAALAPLVEAPLRSAGANSLEALASLASARARAGAFTSIDALLPVYVGQSSAKPNRNRVVVATAE